MIPRKQRYDLIERDHSNLSLTRQCEILGVSRSGAYRPLRGESELNLELMELMDKHYFEHPYKGAKRMHIWLTKDKGFQISLNRIERLYYEVMGLRAILPGPHTSKRYKDHTVYPYLLRGLDIDRPNQVWATDISYIPIWKGYLYLTAIIDLFSRYVLTWSLSNTMHSEWCAGVLTKAVEEYGRAEIINTDQGVQYTSEVFVNCVKSHHMKLSMDGKGRATDNAFIERLWRSVKYEKLYIFKPENGTEAYTLCDEYFRFYNNERRHSSIENRRPAEFFYAKKDELQTMSFPHCNTLKNPSEEDFRVLKVENSEIFIN